MPRVNFHCHTAHSHDARGTVEELALAARARGVDVVCLTNHVETLLDDGETWVLDLEDARRRLGSCLDDVERCRRRVSDVEILFGAELEYRPEWRAGLEELARALPFDFLLGSVHVVDDLQVSGGPGAERAFAGRSEEAVYGPYFERVLEMVNWGRASVGGAVHHAGHRRPRAGACGSRAARGRAAGASGGVPGGRRLPRPAAGAAADRPLGHGCGSGRGSGRGGRRVHGTRGQLQPRAVRNALSVAVKVNGRSLEILAAAVLLRSRGVTLADVAQRLETRRR
ncbi:MAG: PHP domain-containing protein [Gemmatimonadetes bacterium]|nr:PHP domain-containing protein [Gemmatimonadota bacterium]